MTSGIRSSALPAGVEVTAPIEGNAARILTPEALGFLVDLQREFNPTREAFLQRRVDRQAELDGGAFPDFLMPTRAVREGDWKAAPSPRDLLDRRVEITGPTDRKMMINALNSGAKVFMADFEDSNTPSWRNLIDGQVNLSDAIDRTIEFASPDGKLYRLAEETATLVVRPRGWHLQEKHVLVDGKPISGSLFDFGLYFFHNAERLSRHDTGPYFYLPKLESHLEARCWNAVFEFAQERLNVPRGTIKATVLIETILAAFEMDEILYELREHSSGLNAGRWDYMFSIIKKFRNRPEFVLPDRAQVTMTVPFMRAYTQLLVKTCHRRGVHAIGGMAAFIPSRRDAKVNEVALARVRDDKVRESRDGFDGTWVAHPDLVPVAKAEFDLVLGAKPNQLERQRSDVSASGMQLLDVRVPGATVTEGGLRNNVSVALQYLESWLRGIGAAAIFNLMEDVATAEIARSQVWQWVRHGTRTQEGQIVDVALIRALEGEELEKLRAALGSEAFAKSRFADARTIFEKVALGREFVEFLTYPAYDLI